MKRIFLILCIAALIFITSLASPSVAGNNETTQVSTTQLMNSNLPFIQNQGQQPETVKFYTDTFYGTAYITDTDLTHAIAMIKNNETFGVALKEQFVNSNGSVISLTPEGKDPGSTKISYFTGNDSSKWQTDLPVYNFVSLGELYPGITVSAKAYGNNVEKLFSVEPGADPNSIRVKILGVDNIQVTDDGSLAITTVEGKINMTAPKASQNGRNVTIGYRVIGDDIYGFEVGEYDRSKILVIDPVLSYSTYLGGSKNDYGYTLAVDNSGYVYISGSTQSPNFPTTAGAYQTTSGGSYDVFVMKLDADGTNLIYSTYLGGSGNDFGYALSVDESGHAYVNGNTKSSNFPTTFGAYQTTFGGSLDAFIIKLNTDGTDLIYSTYLGGSSSDSGYALAADKSGCAYISGYTSSSDFPTTIGAYQKTLSGNTDVFVTKLNAEGTDLIYSTYLGGSTYDYGYSIALDSTENAYISGYTQSSNFPTTSGAYQENTSSFITTFITKLNTDGTGLVYSTYLGGGDLNYGYSIAVDDYGCAYICGSTKSSNFPITTEAYQTTSGGDTDAFITKMNTDGTDLVYSTYLGGNSDDFGYSIAVDDSMCVYISGTTLSSNFPTTAGAYQKTLSGSTDAFVTKLNADGKNIVYSSYLGGSDAEGTTAMSLQSAIAVDNSQHIYISGYTSSSNFPTTTGTFQTTNMGSKDVFVTKIDSRPPIANFTADKRSGDAPLTINFTDKSDGLTTFWAWDFDNDGLIDAITQNATHTYTNPGNYTVNLTVSNILNSNSVIKTDYITVTTPQPPFPVFKADNTSGDAPLTVHFTDMSTGIITSWAWDFDSDGITDSSEQNPIYTYNIPGNYTVSLTVENSGGKSAVSDHILVSMPAVSVADFTANRTSGVAPLTVYFTSQSVGIVTDWAWDFDNDGKIDATTQNATHTYFNPGNYSVNLKVTNAGGSNSTIKTNYVNVSGISPTADFSSDVTTGKAALTVNFTDNSTGSISGWVWDFNNDGIIDATVRNTSYTYTRAGNYTVNLTVTGPVGSNSAVKTDYIQAMSSIDLSGTAEFETTYPYYNNTVRVMIKNSGTENATAFNVMLLVGENSTALNIPELAAGNSTEFSITDIKRKLGSFPISIIVDPENTVAETNETNNAYNANATIASSGDRWQGGRYSLGYDLINNAIYEEGHVGVAYSLGGTGYTWFTKTGTVTYTIDDLPIPVDATIKSARLYQGWTWYGYPGFTVQFNGHESQEPVASYSDNINGQDVFDVTPYFNASGSNTAVITAGRSQAGYYGTVLVVIYESASEPYRQIWINEGSDCLLYGTMDPYVSYTLMENVSTAGLKSAKLTTVLESRDGDDGTVTTLNGKALKYTGSRGSDPSFMYFDVASALQNGTNELGVNGSSSYTNYAASILEITKETASEANFTADTTSGSASLVVNFTDTSTGTPTNWTWDFGDGENSSEQNPIHTYTAEGTYTVKLTVSNSLGSDSEEKIGYITVGSTVLAPVAEFSANQTTGNASLTVQFTDKSTNIPTSWTWDFGDGETSSEQNPSHNYETAGTYTVKLTATNYGGSNTTTKDDYITVTSYVSAPVASFTADANSGKVPFTVQFKDTSTGKVSSWKWAFGDGSTSTDQNPTHTYVTEGSYNVTLAATGPGGSSTVTSSEPVVVSVPFTADSYNGGIPLTTVQNGTVSGGLWYNSYPGFDTSAQKTFTLPDYTKIKWARLYVTVYDGHMQNNYRGNVTIGIDADGDSSYEIQKNETFDTVYSFPGEGGTGPVWLSDHMNRVTSDYLMWYDLTDVISGQTVNVQATTTKVDSSFDGRVKAMTLVVAYDDGDSDQVYYWVNQGHDTVNPLDETYTGLTSFGTSALSSGWSSANLTSIYLASVDGIYTFNEKTLASGVKSGSYFGFNSWDISSLLTAGQDSALAYNKQGENYFKIPLALMNVRYPSASPALPDAAFAVDVTSGNAPLTVNFTDQSTGSPTSWLWDFDNDGTIDSEEQNPSYTYEKAGTYTVNLTVSNAGGSDSEIKTDYIVVSTSETQDTTKPVIDSVVLFPANTTAGSTINITVNATDDIGVIEVTAGDVQLTKTDGIWQGSITAPTSVGNYSLSINATDAAGNTAEASVPYSVVKLSGGANIAVSPRSSSVPAGNTVALNLKVKNTQNIDDTFKVRISVSELPASYQAGLAWFNWTEKVVSLKAGEEVLIPVEVTVPEGTATGRKLFRANMNSEMSSITGFDTGYLTIT